VISNITTLAAGIPVSTNIGINNLLIDLKASKERERETESENLRY